MDSYDSDDILVHGSGSATRYGAVPFKPLIEIFLRNGFAVLSWDKPGSGESRGEFGSEYEITERAKIIVDATSIMVDNPFHRQNFPTKHKCPRKVASNHLTLDSAVSGDT